MKCPKCNSETEEGSNFCPQCGSDLKKAAKEAKKRGKQKQTSGSAPEEPPKSGAPAEEAPKDEGGPEGSGGKGASAGPASEGGGGGADQAPKASGPETAAVPPKGKIGGGLLAAAIAAGALAVIGVACGIAQTAITSASNASSSQDGGSGLASGNSSLRSSSSDGGGGSSLSASSSSSSTSSSSSPSSGSSQASSNQGATDAVSDLESAQNCSNEGGSATLQASSSGQSAFTVSGTGTWGPVLSCVAQGTSMPAADQAKIKAFVNQMAADADEGSDSSASPKTLSWSLGDKSEIYATFAPSPEGQGGWTVGFGGTEAASAADFPDSQSSGQGSDGTPQGSDAASALQTSAQQCSTGGVGADLESNPSGPDMLVVSGQDEWGNVLSCVAQETSMPAADQAKIKSFVNATSSNPDSALPEGSLDWSMKDGSKIYVSYAPAASQPGAWIVDMGDEPSGGGE